MADTPPLLISGLLFAAMVVFFGAGILLDGRYILDAPAWLKPTKFAVSFVIYNFTLLWMLSFVQNRPRLVSGPAWLIVLTSLIEIAAIAGQAARDTTSHYNTVTPLDAAVWSVMGGRLACCGSPTSASPCSSCFNGLSGQPLHWR